MSAALAAPNLPARLAAAIELLCQGITASLPGNWGKAALALRAWTRLNRLLARFAALVAALEAGRVPVSRPRAGTVSRPRPEARATRLPGGAGWLLRLAPALDTRLGRAQVESLLGDPELASLLAQAPEAGRILRPLCHALRIEPPPALLPPRRSISRKLPEISGSTDAEAAECETSLAVAARRSLPTAPGRPEPDGTYCASGQPPWSSGRNASPDGIVETRS